MSPLAPPSSGSGSSSGSSGPSRAALAEAGLGLITQSYNVNAPGTQNALVSGSIYGVAVGLAAGDTITNLLASVATAGVGTVPTLIRQGIADSTGKVLAVTATSQASAVWTTLGMASVALTAPLVISAAGLYYLCIIEVGAFGTTPMQIRGAANSGGGPGQVAGFPRAQGNQTGQTDLPAVNSSIVFAGSNTIGHWLGCN